LHIFCFFRDTVGYAIFQLCLQVTPIIPNFTGNTFPQRMSIASVPLSIMSNLVTTASVRLPKQNLNLALKKSKISGENRPRTVGVLVVGQIGNFEILVGTGR